MLINFSFENFKSFKEMKTLSMEAASIKEHKESLIERAGCKLLPVAVLYGANSSGKSNMIDALACMRYMVLLSVKLNPGDNLSHVPFVLDKTSRNKPTMFEIQFMIGNVKYRYGFEYSAEKICAEWLYEREPKKRENNLFIRAGQEFEISKTKFPEGIGKDVATNENRLFVSLCAQLRGEKSLNIIKWFTGCNCISGLDSYQYKGYTYKILNENLEESSIVNNLFKKLNLGFEKLVVKDKEVTDDMLKGMNINIEEFNKVFDRKMYDPKTEHIIYDEEGNEVDRDLFDLLKMESEGSKKIIELAGPLVNTLFNGGIMVIDELDAKLHPILTRSIVQMFMSPETNKKGAQLIFATHDTNLLDVKFLRRDQIWFTEKNKIESSDLYSLVEFKDECGAKVRNDKSIRKDYINGRYGAIPFLS